MGHSPKEPKTATIDGRKVTRLDCKVGSLNKQYTATSKMLQTAYTEFEWNKELYIEFELKSLF